MEWKYRVYTSKFNNRGESKDLSKLVFIQTIQVECKENPPTKEKLTDLLAQTAEKINGVYVFNMAIGDRQSIRPHRHASGDVYGRPPLESLFENPKDIDLAKAFIRHTSTYNEHNPFYGNRPCRILDKAITKEEIDRSIFKKKVPTFFDSEWPWEVIDYIEKIFHTLSSAGYLNVVGYYGFRTPNEPMFERLIPVCESIDGKIASIDSAEKRR